MLSTLRKTLMTTESTAEPEVDNIEVLEQRFNTSIAEAAEMLMEAKIGKERVGICGQGGVEPLSD